MRILISLWLVLALAGPSIADEAKSLPEVDALRLEKAELEVRGLTAEIQARQERIERIKAEALLYIEKIRQRDGVHGWELDLANRKWIRPSAERVVPSVEPKKEAPGGN